MRGEKTTFFHEKKSFLFPSRSPFLSKKAGCFVIVQICLLCLTRNHQHIPTPSGALRQAAQRDLAEVKRSFKDAFVVRYEGGNIVK